MIDRDGRFLDAAIRLGARRNGLSSPNPAVGAIVVGRRGQVLGRAATAPGGRPHGEPQALLQAGGAAEGATVYVSLEPCSHQGRGPPCADALLGARVGRVVAAMADPDPRVAGEGLRRLAAHGVTAETLALARPGAAAAHAGHLAHLHLGRPHVTLKLAVSADGAIGRPGVAQTEVTGASARRHAQALRTRFDAIVVGATTAVVDDPLLTVRLPGLAKRSPRRVVVAGGTALPPRLRLFATAEDVPTLVLSPAERPAALPPGVRWITVATDGGGLALGDALRALDGEGLRRLFVEGGARLAATLLDADLVDGIVLFRSPRVLGAGALPAPPFIRDLANRGAAPGWARGRSRRFGPDRMSSFTKVR